jgi:hypothetical protein
VVLPLLFLFLLYNFAGGGAWRSVQSVRVVLPLLFLVLLCFCIILQEEGRDEAYSQKGWYYLFDADDRSHHHPDVSSARTVDATHM